MAKASDLLKKFGASPAPLAGGSKHAIPLAPSKPEEGAKPEDATAEPSAPASPAPALAPATPPVAAQPATELARAAADDPVQSVFFTSFIIQ